MFDNTVEQNAGEYNMCKKLNRRAMDVVRENVKKIKPVEEVKEPEHLNTQQIKLQLRDDYKKKKVDELKKICKDKKLKGYSKLKKNELIDKLIEHYEHEIREVAEREIEEARLKHLIPVEHKKREKYVRQDLQAIHDMAEDVKRMRKERLKRTRQFRGSVMSHQEKVQESVNRAKKRIEQRNRVINERNYPFQGTIQPTFDRRNISVRQKTRHEFGILPKQQRMSG